MALLNNDVAKGVAIGIGAALLAPLAFVALSGVGRPAARAAIKAGLLVFDKGRETVAELGEVVEDLIAEAQAEIESEREHSEPAAGAESPGAAEETGAEAPMGMASAPESEAADEGRARK